MKTSSLLLWLPLTVVSLTALPLHGQDEEKKPPLKLATALKLGVEGLTEKYTDPSEAGQDQAAQLFADAKRIETEYALAQRDLSLVVSLNEWRQAISPCREGCPGLEGILMGGGTMYSHGAARDGAEVEVFLAGLAKRLPLAEGKGDAKSSKAVKDAIAEIKKLKLEPDAEKEAKKELADEINHQVENWTNLSYMLETIPAEDAKSIATFTLQSLSWIREEEEKK